MTTYRFSLVLLGAACLLSLGCPKDEDTGDSEADADTDADTDADADADSDSDVDYFEAYAQSWHFYGGIKGGQVADAYGEAGGDPIPPMLVIEIWEEGYVTSGDDRYICYLPFVVESTTGTLDPKAWYDWAFELTPYTDGEGVCDSLDPAMFGEDPWAAFSAETWEMSIFEPDSGLSEWLSDMDDWEKFEQYFFGGTTFRDGEDWSEGNDFVWNYGIAFEVDADMVIGEDWIAKKDIAAGADGWYQIYSAWYQRFAR